jgi:DNA polymerase-1
VTDHLAVDVETTGTDPWGSARIFSYSVTDWYGYTEIFRSCHKDFLRLLKHLFRLLTSSRAGAYNAAHRPTLIFHNAHFDLRFIGKLLGRPVWREVEFHDTMLLSHIVRNNHYSHALEDLAFDLAGWPKVDAKIAKIAKEVGGYHKVPEAAMDAYQTADGQRTMLLFRWLWPLVQKDKKWLDCYQTELEMVRCALEMENRGVKLSPSRTEALRKELMEEVSELKGRLQRLAWEGFNPKSVYDLRKLLFEDWGVKSRKMTKKGSRSVDKHVLLKIREEADDPRKEIIDGILKHNSYQTGVAILKGYLESAHGGIIHPNINTCAAVTSRQSISNPNLHNVSKEDVLLNPFPVPARRCFVPRSGYVNLHVDFSGIEMRLLIHYSKDPVMIQCILEERDPHDLAALVFYQDRWKEAHGEERKKLRGAAKNANFATPYGAGAEKIVQTLGLPQDEGTRAFDRYKARFPTLTHLSKIIAKQVYNYGHVETAFGRRLYVPKYEAYMGLPYVIQGTAAEILKRAQIRIHKLNRSAANWQHCYLILTIHDEVVLEFPLQQIEEIHNYMSLIRELMTDFHQFSVPLEVEMALVVSDWSKKRILPNETANRSGMGNLPGKLGSGMGIRRDHRNDNGLRRAEWGRGRKNNRSSMGALVLQDPKQFSSRGHRRKILNDS